MSDNQANFNMTQDEWGECVEMDLYFTLTQLKQSNQENEGFRKWLLPHLLRAHWEQLQVPDQNGVNKLMNASDMRKWVYDTYQVEFTTEWVVLARKDLTKELSYKKR